MPGTGLAPKDTKMSEIQQHYKTNKEVMIQFSKNVSDGLS